MWHLLPIQVDVLSDVASCVLPATTPGHAFRRGWSSDTARHDRLFHHLLHDRIPHAAIWCVAETCHKEGLANGDLRPVRVGDEERRDVGWAGICYPGNHPLEHRLQPMTSRSLLATWHHLGVIGAGTRLLLLLRDDRVHLPMCAAQRIAVIEPSSTFQAALSSCDRAMAWCCRQLSKTTD